MASSRPCISRIGGHPAGVILRDPEVLLSLGLYSHRSSLLQVKIPTAGKKILRESELKGRDVPASGSQPDTAAGSQEQF